MDVKFLQLLLYHRVIIPVDESVLRSLVLGNPHLCVGIILELKIVAVEMVGGNVQQHSDVGPEVVHIVELERTQFDNVVLMRVLSHLQGQTLSYVSGETGIVAGTLEDVVYETCRCRLTITSCYTNHFRVGIRFRQTLSH